MEAEVYREAVSYLDGNAVLVTGSPVRHHTDHPESLFIQFLID